MKINLIFIEKSGILYTINKQKYMFLSTNTRIKPSIIPVPQLIQPFLFVLFNYSQIIYVKRIFNKIHSNSKAEFDHFPKMPGTHIW
jgi:hypothetical protein